MGTTFSKVDTLRLCNGACLLSMPAPALAREWAYLRTQRHLEAYPQVVIHLHTQCTHIN